MVISTDPLFDPTEVQLFYSICKRRDIRALQAFLDTEPRLFRAIAGDAYGANGPGISPVAWNVHAGWDLGLLAIAARPDLVNYNQTDRYGRTALHWLVMANNVRQDRLLLRYIEAIPEPNRASLDGNQADVAKLTPLHHAARNLDLEATEILLSLPGIDPEICSNGYHFTEFSPHDLSNYASSASQKRLDHDEAMNRIAMYRAMARNLLLNRIARQTSDMPTEEQLKKMDIYAAI